MFNPTFKIEFQNVKSISTNNFLASIEKEVEDLFDNDDLLFIAQGIKQQIERNMFSSIDYEGKKLEPHSLAWAEKKGHHKNLFWKGLLYRSIAIQQIPNGYEIFVLPLSDGDTPRDEVAAYLNPRWPFFGIIPERVDSIVNDAMRRSAKL